MRTESITWHDLPADGLPDAEISVLVAYKLAGETEVDTWPAWWSGEHWIDASTGDRMERDGRCKVLRWSDMPIGGEAC